MKIELMVATYLEGKKQAANEELRTRLSRGKSFEEMLAELGAIEGFNVEERAYERRFEETHALTA